MPDTKRQERKYIQFTPKDGLTVRAVFEARYLTNVHVRELFYSPTTYGWCKQRLRYLYDKGYLAFRQASLTSPYVYYLALKGRRYVARYWLDWSKEQVDKIAGVAASGDEVADLQIRHDLELSNLYVQAVKQCREVGWSLSWENARMLEVRKMGVQPDAYLRVAGQGIERKAWVEYTSAMPSYQAFAKKLKSYERVIVAKPDTLILWLTTSKAKEAKLYHWARNYRFKEWIAFGQIEDRSGFLTRAMWQMYGKTGPRRLMVAGQGERPDVA